MAEEYAWLVYMAGDNDLGNRVDFDLEEIEEGTRGSDVLTVAVHADRQKQPSTHIVFGKLGKREEPLGVNANAGLAVTLTDFLKRGKNGAKHHVACIWSHGYGWLATAFDEARDQQVPVRNSRKALMAASRGLFKNSVLETTVRTPTQSVVDEAGRDFLDMAELRRGLHDALDRNDKFAIIGCDACYMAMLEVAYELRDEGEIFVASEEEEEPGGWNYSEVLGKFKPGLSPTEAATEIVNAYEPQTQAEPRATLSAIKLDEIGEVAEAVNTLGELLTPLIATARFGAIKNARAKVHTFKLYHYIDLLHFAECLKAELGADEAVEDVADAADDVIKAVKGAVVAMKNGASAANAHGIAVYLPNEPVNPNYAKLALAQHAPRWFEFVQTYGANR